MKLAIQGVLAVAVVVLAWLIYNSIDSRIQFEDTSAKRKLVVVESLKNIREAQISFKSVKGVYAKTFEQLIDFVKYDSMPYIKAIGTVPDTLTEQQAVEMGLVVRDTFKIAIRDTLFNAGFPYDSLPYVPFSGGSKFEMDAGQIEINKLNVQVFEAKTDLGKILTGLNPQKQGVKVDEYLKVGSMTDASTTGNWE